MKIFELIVGYPPFDNLMPKRDDLIREWMSMFGDPPEEYRNGLLLKEATSKWLLTSFSFVTCDEDKLARQLSTYHFRLSARFESRYLILDSRGPRVYLS